MTPMYNYSSTVSITAPPVCLVGETPTCSAPAFEGMPRSTVIRLWPCMHDMRTLPPPPPPPPLSLPVMGTKLLGIGEGSALRSERGGGKVKHYRCRLLEYSSGLSMVPAWYAPGNNTGTILAATGINPFRTAFPFWGQNTWNLTDLSPERDCGSERVNSSAH